MGKRNLKIIYSNYSGVEKKAIELVNREVGEINCRDAMVYTIHVIALEKDGAPVDKTLF